MTRRSALAAVCVAAALLALFGSAAGSRAASSSGSRAVQSVLVSIALPLVAVAAAVAVVSVIILLLRRPQLPAGAVEGEESPRWARLVALLLALAVFAFCIYAILSTPHHHLVHLATAGGRGGRHVLLTRGGVKVNPLVSSITAALLVGGLALALFVRRVPQRNLQSVPVAARTLVAPVTAAPEVLPDPSLEPEPRRAVILAYQSFVALMSMRGLTRRDNETPLEYARRLSRSGLHAAAHEGVGAADELASLFNVARYASEPVTPADRRRALECLFAVRRVAIGAP